MHQLSVKHILLFAVTAFALASLFSPGLRADMAGLLCFRSIGCMTGDGQDICVDTDNDGIPCEPGEPNLMMNAPTNAAGDETVQGNLTVVGSITETGVTHVHERMLFDFSTAIITSAGVGAPLPDANDCWALRGDYEDVIIGTATDPGGRCRQRLSYDVRITRICGTLVDGSVPTAGNCQIEFYTEGERSTPLATINVSTGTAGDLDSVERTVCVPVGVNIEGGTEAAPEALYAQASASDCDPADNWPEVYFEVLGYGIDLP